MLVFLGPLGKESNELLLLGVPGVAQKNRFLWWQQPQPTFLSIAQGGTNLAQPIGNSAMTVFLLEITPSFVCSLNQLEFNLCFFIAESQRAVDLTVH